MAMSVPLSSIICMIITGMISFGIPIALFIYLIAKKDAEVLPFFVGCAVMFLFALVLEPLVHEVVLGSPVGEKIRGNTWLYALYGGLMAGLFEETGRFAAFRTVLRKYLGNDKNALMYGAGHGGLEAALLVGTAMINNIIFSVMINLGQTEMITSELTGDVLAQTEQAFRTLVETKPGMFLAGGIERIFAIVLQISLSVLVWFAVKKMNRSYLYPLAILLHCLVDAAMVVVSDLTGSILITEVTVGIGAVLTALIAIAVWKKNADKSL